MSMPSPRYELDERVVEPKKEQSPPVRNRVVPWTFDLESETCLMIGLSAIAGWIGFLVYKMLWDNPFVR